MLKLASDRMNRQKLKCFEINVCWSDVITNEELWKNKWQVEMSQEISILKLFLIAQTLRKQNSNEKRGTTLKPTFLCVHKHLFPSD